MAKQRILGYKLSQFPYGNGNGDPGNVIFKGVINEPADFPTLAVVQVGWEYQIGYKERITSITNDGGTTATVTVSSTFYNNFINGDNLIIEGYTGAEATYNGTFVGTKGSPNTITYPLTYSPPSPAIGAGFISAPDTVTDNDAAKTNTDQIFQNNDEIRWNGTAWSLIGADRIWKIDGDKILQYNPNLAVQLDGNVTAKQDVTIEDDLGVWNRTTIGQSGQADGILKIIDDTGDQKVLHDSSNDTYDIHDVLVDTALATRITPQDTIIFDISGNDTTGDGSEAYPFFTLQKAIAYIKATFTPSATNQYTAKALTDYTLADAGDLTSADWINIEARGCHFRMNVFIIGDNNIVNIGEMTRLSGVGEVVRKVGTGKSVINCVNLHNTISAGTIHMVGGELIINGSSVRAQNASTLLINQDGGSSGTKCIINATDEIVGKAFTVVIDAKVKLYTDNLDGDMSINAGAASIIGGRASEWTGKIAQADALSNLWLDVQKRHTNPSNDSVNNTANIFVNELESPHIRIYPSAATQSVSASTATRILYNTLDGTAYQIRHAVPETVSALTSVSTLATATIPANLYAILVDGDNVTIAGANEVPYNGTFAITKIGSNQITYTMGSTTTSPATGSPTISANGIITCDVNGRYIVRPSYALDDSSVGQSREIYLQVNRGSGYIRENVDTERQQGSTSDTQAVGRSYEVFLRKGDKIFAEAWQDAISLNINGGSSYKDRSYISIQKVGN